MTRPFRQRICRALIGVLLFAQMAIAAYACPGLSSAFEKAREASTPAAAMSMAMAAAGDEVAASNGDVTTGPAMDCEQMAAAMDPELPNLCAQHCQQGDQSDHASTITVPPVILASLYVLAPPSATMRVPPASGAQPGVFVAASPPHSILHCCLRD